MKHDGIDIPFIQFIIGNYKRNHILYGPKGGYSLHMNSLCRDCDINSLDGDNICIGRDVMFSFYQNANVIGENKDEIIDYSFLTITNKFN